MKKFMSLFALVIAAVVASAANINISWPANPAAEQISAYNVYCSTNGGPTTLMASTPVNTLAVTNLPGGLYVFTIRARNIWGEAPASNPVSTPPQPSQVVNVTITISVQ